MATTTWEEYELPVGGPAELSNGIAPTVIKSSDLRRTIIGAATPYKRSPHAVRHHVVGSANFSENMAHQGETCIHPLSELRMHDPRWLQPMNGIHCFHCCQPLDKAPVWLPQSLDERGIYWVRPTPFCSLSCAKAHLIAGNPFDAAQQLLLLNRVARDVYKFKGKIVTAPPRQCLRMFGGNMEVDEFKRMHLHTRVALEHAPFLPLDMFVEKTPVDARHATKTNTTVQQEGAPSSTKPGQPDGGNKNSQSSSRWSVANLRRPDVPQSLPRASHATMGPSLLEQFTTIQQSDGKWDSSSYEQPRVVTSETPSIAQVNAARDATMRRETVTPVLPKQPRQRAKAQKNDARHAALPTSVVKSQLDKYIATTD